MGVKETQNLWRHCNFCLKKINNINAYTEFADVKKKIKLLIWLIDWLLLNIQVENKC